MHKFLLLALILTASISSQASLVEQRIEEERENYQNSFVLTAHKTNYILPFTYQHKPNEEPFKASGSDINLQNAEAKFQISLKVPVTRKTLLPDNGYLYFAYTARSVWQAYNADESSLFRDTNHEAEIFINFTTPLDWRGLSIPLTTVGFTHQSNGQDGSLSRSWNRIYLDTILHYDDWYLSIKPWWRIPEKEKSQPGDSKGDDNPDIHQYYGYFELRAVWPTGKNETSIMLRHNLKASNYGAVEINYSYPLNSRVKGYVQLFHGYGETLLDYDHRNTRLGFGFLFSSWL